MRKEDDAETGRDVRWRSRKKEEGRKEDIR